MKKLYSIAALLLFVFTSQAQIAIPEAPYKKEPNLPAFSIQQADSSWFTGAQIPKYDYTAIVYFSPTCGHCQVAAQDIVAHMDSLKNVFFVFVSYNPLNEIKEFGEHYKLIAYPNVRMGRDPKYFLPSFYRVEATPFVAVYDKNRKLIDVFDPPHKPAMEASQLIELINKK